MIQIRLAVILFVLCMPLVMADFARADDDYKVPDVDALFERIQKLVEKHYPKAKVQRDKHSLYFELYTRQFMIHIPTLNGVWQDAKQEKGPQPGGIYGNIEVRRGTYTGQMRIPQTDDVRYYKRLWLAPYSKSLDHHLYVRLRYPEDASKEFLDDFTHLVTEFVRHEDVIKK